MENTLPQDLSRNAMIKDSDDSSVESRRQKSIIWFFLAHSLLLAAGVLIYFKWDESVKGSFHRRGLFFEMAIFLIILITSRTGMYVSSQTGCIWLEPDRRWDMHSFGTYLHTITPGCDLWRCELTRRILLVQDWHTFRRLQACSSSHCRRFKINAQFARCER